jgi:hypothetical protein
MQEFGLRAAMNESYFAALKAIERLFKQYRFDAQ